MSEMKKIPKEKFVLVQTDKILYDQKMQTKSLSYFQDAMIRFRKNKASVVAAIILSILIIMAIIGPFLVKYNLNDLNQKWANRLEKLPPKIENVESGFWSGNKTITNFPGYFEYEVPEEIIIELYEDDVNSAGQIDALVDYYAYTNWQMSYKTKTSLSIDEYEQVKEYDNSLLNDDNPDNDDQVLIINDAPELNGTYKVNIHFFEFLDVIYDTEVQFIFGSDDQGRDLFTELWKGARVSLMIATAVASINIIVGVIIGSISGYFGGIVDLVIERLSEILSGLPFLAILSILLLTYGNKIWVVILAFTMTGWLGIARLTRAQFYRYKYREYVLAARTLGANDKRLMFKHILPNAIGTLITSFVLYIPGVIFTESTYSFLGIINYAETTSVGRLLSNGQLVLKTHFYLELFPAVFISLLMLSFNLFGNGLRDAFNPSLRGVEE
ncbi:ABC transporter permease [Candidatus Izemoplasma sp. B36]|uniref:ABC transporter permease n=1 Tax=Candidatus Izemoplasma sp. B36 TaxID=3242468 RepID=UPI0035561008